MDVKANEEKLLLDHLIKLDDENDLIISSKASECIICLTNIPIGDCIVLRDCLHSFCKMCLTETIRYSVTPYIQCPYRDSEYSCESHLQHREIRALISLNEFENFLLRSLKIAELSCENSFHCKKIDCIGWCIKEEVGLFTCPICAEKNCLQCAAIHEGINCQLYKQIELVSNTDENDRKTKDKLRIMIASKQAMPCPSCKIIICKEGGCEHMICSVCKTSFIYV